MNLARMLMEKRTRTFLIKNWGTPENNPKLSLVRAEEEHAYLIKYILITCIFYPTLLCLGLPIYKENQIEVGFGILFSTIVFVYGVLFLWLRDRKENTNKLKAFNKDSDNLYLELGEKIETSNSHSELEKHAFEKLVEAAELCLWAQRFHSCKFELILEKQARFKYLYDLFENFGLASDGYTKCYDEANKRSEVPNWFMKMDPKINQFEPSE